MQRKMIAVGVVACVLALVIGGLCLAQPPQGDNRAERGQRGGGQFQFDPARMAEMQQRMMERWKETLGADDEAWKVIQPRLTKVMELNRQQGMAGRGGMFGPAGMRGRGDQGPGGRGGPQGDRPRFPGQENRTPSEVEKAAEALATTLENQSASADEIKQRLTALRSAREKAKSELARAQQDLKQILTVRQEAILVNNGQLD
jgi:hypothetical protein